MKTMIDVTCKHCGKVYQVHPSRVKKTKYCSGSCRASDHIGENAFRWKGGKVQKVCENCGKAYAVFPALAPESRFWSKSCHSSFTNRGDKSNFWKGGTHTKICPHCGTGLMVYPGETRRKYCSTKCLDEARMKRSTLVCPQCGNSFIRKQSKIRYANSFCSMV